MDSIGIWGATTSKGSGIGNEILRKLTKNSEQPIYLFGRSTSKLEKAVGNLTNVKGIFTWDVENEEKSTLYQNYIVDNNIRTLICCIGTGVGDPLPFLTKKDFIAMINSNLLVPSLIIKHSIVPLKRLQGGRIIVFGSIVAFKPSDGASGYVGTKTGLRGIVEATRNEIKAAFPEVSLHAIYANSAKRVGLSSVVEATLFLTTLPFGVSADIILDK
jgi:short-subunit dehydrogenase